LIDAFDVFDAIFFVGIKSGAFALEILDDLVRRSGVARSALAISVSAFDLIR